MTVYLNGQFMPLEEARIPVLDRGFMFGDGIYEVVPVYSRRAFRLAEHLHRLQRSLDAIRLRNPHSGAEWEQLLGEMIARNAGDDLYLYIHITRGVAPRDHPFPSPPVPPTVFLMTGALLSPDPAMAQAGVSAISAEDNRWMRCDIKSTSLLPNVLLRQLAVDANCSETVLFRPPAGEEDATLTEGTASNIFAVQRGTLLAPPQSHLMLPGITYGVMLELAEAAGIPYTVRRISKTEVFAADELLLTSSTREVQAITRLDGQAIGGGKPGPVFAELYRRYQDFKRTVMRAGKD